MHYQVEKDFVITRFVNICWYFFKIAAVLALFVVIGLGVFLFTRLDDEIRRQAEQVLAREFPQYNINIGGARLVEGQGIAIYDLTVSETSSTQLQSNLLVVDEIMLSCNAKLSKLVKGLPTVSRIVVKHPQVWVAKDNNGQWNFSSLLPLPECKKQRPELIIENAQITLVDQSRGDLPPLSLRDLYLRLQPLPDEQLANNGQHGNIPLKPSDQPFKIQGKFGGPLVKHAEFTGHFDPSQLALHLTSKFEQLQINESLLAWASALNGESLDPKLLWGKLDGNIAVSHQLNTGRQPRFDANFRLSEARLSHPRLPQSVVDLSCLIHCENDLLKVQELRGKCGTANIALQLQRRGWSPQAPIAVGVSLTNITLDTKVHNALPPILQDQWFRYQPAGLVNAELQATFDGQRWTPTVKLTGRELSFESDKFRYRVKDGHGTMNFTPPTKTEPAVLDIDLIGHGGGQPMHFVGQVFDPKPGALCWIEITGSDVKIEDEMISALPGKSRNVIESIHPTGTFNFRWRLDRMQPGQIKPHTALRLELVDTQVLYDKFQYPISGISGLILAEDQSWTFRDLVSSGSHKINGLGYLRPLGPDEHSGKELYLRFTGENVPLDHDLHHAVPSGVQRAWDELRPRGNVNLQSEISYFSGSSQADISVVIKPRPESTTIRPKFFDYLMENLAGTINYQDGKILLDQIAATHGSTEIRTNGDGEFRNDGSWNVHFEGLSVDRLQARRELTNALPKRLQKMVESLQPYGSFSLSNGDLQFSKSSDLNASTDAIWDIQLNCSQVDLQVGLELKNIHGTIRLKGESKGNHTYSAGALAIDSATFQDVQFTDIQGPIWVDEGRCLFGEWVPKQAGEPVRRMTARAYDGFITANAGVSFDVVPNYRAVAVLTDANLNRLMKERIDGSLDYNGKIGATLTLNGRGRSLDTLAGHGEFQISDANIYQLPMLVGMLKMLRNETPDSIAFNEVHSKYRMQGQHIYLDQLDFKGDAVSLLGKGWANFDQQIKLDFHAVVGRNEISLPFVKKIVNRVGEHTLQMTVSGDAANPKVSTRALPGIKKFFQQFQSTPDTIAPPSSTEPRNAERTFPSWPTLGRQ